MNQNKIDKITGAIFLIGLGVLLITGWWWPGIIAIVAIPSLLGSILAGKIKDAVTSVCIFGLIFLLVFTPIPFGVIIGVLIIVGGGWTLLQIIRNK